jgi:type IV pilus assembly protein PilX
MLTKIGSPALVSNSAPQSRQGGVVMLIALIMLVALTLAGIALLRTVDTGALIAGNVAFQQSALVSSDAGIERAVAELIASQNNNTATVTTLTPYDLTGASYSANAVPGIVNGYVSNGLNPAYYQPVAGNSTYGTWDTWWTYMQSLNAVKAGPTAADGAGNNYAYVIHRLCTLSTSYTDPNNRCAAGLGLGTNNSGMGAGELHPSGAVQIYYRITVKTTGPRNSSSLVQAIAVM